MQTITTIGLDIAKSVFQVHGVDAGGQMIVSRKLKRRYVLAFFQKLAPCLVGIEACASAHHWSRELQALGHTVRLMPPAYVKPYVKRQKNDATDAEAICEAVTRANMRFGPTKTPEQQSGLVLHRLAGWPLTPALPRACLRPYCRRTCNRSSRYIPQSRIRVPWISSVLPSMMLVRPVRSSAAAAEVEIKARAPAIQHRHLRPQSAISGLCGGSRVGPLSVPIEVRPHVGAPLATSVAGKPRFQVGQPDVIRPSVATDRGPMAASEIRAIDQEAANSLRRAFPRG
jgi:hypothetical protein